MMATGDFNGDGIVDLLLGGTNTETSWRFSWATCMADSPLMRELEVGLRPASLAAGDLTGDGIADVVAADRRDERVVILSGDGTGGFGAPMAVSAASSSSRTPTPASDAGLHRVSRTTVPQRIPLSRRQAAVPTCTEGVLSLTLSPAAIAGGSGASSTGTVTLNAPAPDRRRGGDARQFECRAGRHGAQHHRSRRGDPGDVHRHARTAVSPLERIGFQRHHLRHPRSDRAARRST